MRTHFMMMIKGVTAAVVISTSPRTRKVVSFSIWRRERTVRYEWKESNQEESNEWNQKEQVRKESGPKQNGRRRRHCVCLLLGWCFLLVTIKINLKDFRLLLFFSLSLSCFHSFALFQIRKKFNGPKESFSLFHKCETIVAWFKSSLKRRECKKKVTFDGKRKMKDTTSSPALHLRLWEKLSLSLFFLIHQVW